MPNLSSVGLSPEVVAALIGQFAVPELLRWLASLRAEGRIVTEVEAMSKLGLDVDSGNALGESFLSTHPEPPKKPA